MYNVYSEIQTKLQRTEKGLPNDNFQNCIKTTIVRKKYGFFGVPRNVTKGLSVPEI